MGKHSKALLLLLSVFCFGALLVPGMTLQASAAGKKGLVQTESGEYVYYKDGSKLKKQWKRVKVDGEKYWFYFKSNGNAYRGKTKKVQIYDEDSGGNVSATVEKPLVKTIDGVKYAFDSQGHALTGVQYFNDKFYYFSDPRGKYNEKKTKKLRNACKYGKTTTLPDLLKKYGLKPVKKTNLGKSCMGSGNDWLYEYERFSVTMLKKKNGTFVFQMVEQTK